MAIKINKETEFSVQIAEALRATGLRCFYDIKATTKSGRFAVHYPKNKIITLEQFKDLEDYTGAAISFYIGETFLITFQF